MHSKIFTYSYLRNSLQIGGSRCFWLLFVSMLASGCDVPDGEWSLHSLHRTTSGQLAAANLDSQIRHWGAADTGEVETTLRMERREKLIRALLERARLRLSTDDFARALRLSGQWVEQAADEPRPWLVHAHAAAALHEFNLASHALDRAEGLGLPAEATASLRCSLASTAGAYSRALACTRQLTEQMGSTTGLGLLAGALGDVGRYEDAANAYARAWKQYRDPSPFVPAWLALGEAKMWMAAGWPERAETLLAFMLRRFPQHLGMQVEYAVALEANGKRGEAIATLEAILDQTSDPDLPNLLAIWLAEAGQSERAALLASQARREYAKRLEQFPSAYAAHAVEYWLGPGDDPQQALSLALLNREAGPTVASLALLAQAAAAADDLNTACEAARAFLNIGEQRLAAKRRDSRANEIKALADACPD